MQPYFFPYIGYWQLINLVDKFIILDDVTYIKGGWINRNCILVNNTSSYITVPLVNQSSNKLICETKIVVLNNWRNKMIKTLEMTYKRAPYFNDVFILLTKLIEYKCNNLVDYLVNHITEICQFLEIKTHIISTSRNYKDNELSGESRIIDICKLEGANMYVNAQGGRELYGAGSFKKELIDLRFISSRNIKYQQFGDIFVPWLSIIDILMFNSKEDINSMLQSYELIE